MKRALGRSGIQVSAMGLGCWAIGGPFWRGDVAVVTVFEHQPILPIGADVPFRRVHLCQPSGDANIADD